jgi:hypothetical protein
MASHPSKITPKSRSCRVGFHQTRVTAHWVTGSMGLPPGFTKNRVASVDPAPPNRTCLVRSRAPGRRILPWFSLSDSVRVSTIDPLPLSRSCSLSLDSTLSPDLSLSLTLSLSLLLSLLMISLSLSLSHCVRTRRGRKKKKEKNNKRRRRQLAVQVMSFFFLTTSLLS